MTVLLDKPLTKRQKWVLEYLNDQSDFRPRLSAHGYWDDGATFVREYAFAFGLLLKERIPDPERSLNRVLRQLREIGLVASEDTSNHGVVGTHDHGPSHNNEWWITNRGKRAVISLDTYETT